MSNLDNENSVSIQESSCFNTDEIPEEVASTDFIEQHSIETQSNNYETHEKRRVSRSEKIALFREMIQNNFSREQIQEAMGVSTAVFYEFYFYVSQESDLGIKISYQEPIRKPLVTDSGFVISKNNITLLKLDNVFVEYASVELKVDEEGNIIARAIPGSAEKNRAKALERARERAEAKQQEAEAIQRNEISIPENQEIDQTEDVPA